MLNTQWKDYGDPYMWCCGCIPPVRLNPICYRFGAKEAKVQQAPEGGWRLPCSCSAVHSTAFISQRVPSEASLSRLFLYLCITVFWLLLLFQKREQRILAHVKAVISSLFLSLFFFFLLNSYFSNYFIFPLWLSQARILQQFPPKCGSN